MHVLFYSLTAFLDTAATGSRPDTHPDAGKSASELPKLLDRRLNKTCAKFVNGVRVGFGFVFERTCRQHTCEAGCMVDAPTCRYFDLLSHHKVVLRTPESIVAQAVALGRVSDVIDSMDLLSAIIDALSNLRRSTLTKASDLTTFTSRSPSKPLAKRAPVTQTMSPAAFILRLKGLPISSLGGGACSSSCIVISIHHSHLTIILQVIQSCNVIANQTGEAVPPQSTAVQEIWTVSCDY